LAAALILAAGSGQARISDESVKYHEEAKAYLEKGEINAALIQLKNAIRSDPDNVKARFDLALIYLRGGDGPSAEKELKAARQRGMEEDEVLLPLTEAYLLQGKFQEVLDEVDPGDRETGLKTSLLVARGRAYVALKKPDEAEGELRAALELSPEMAEAYVASSQVYQIRGDLTKAEAMADKALAMLWVPSSPHATSP